MRSSCIPEVLLADPTRACCRFGSVGGGNVVFNGDSFSLKQRLPLPLRRLGLRYPRFELEVRLGWYGTTVQGF